MLAPRVLELLVLVLGIEGRSAGGDGALSVVPGSTGGATTSPNYVSCGVNPAGQSITYTLPASTSGYDITNIVVYGGWADAGRNEQKYNIFSILTRKWD